MLLVLSVLLALCSLPVLHAVPVAMHEQMLAFVEQSPAANTVDEWLQLFSHDAVLTDPVSAPAHRGHAELRRFHATFIGSNKISFIVLRNFVDVESSRVVRLVNISVESRTHPGQGVFQPCHIVYDLNVTGSRQHWKIRALRAHWQPTGTRLRGESPGQQVYSLAFMARIANSMLMNLGPAFSMQHWMSSLVGPLSLGGRLLGQLLLRAQLGDQLGFLDLFTRPNDKNVLMGGKKVDASEVFTRLNGGQFEIIDYQTCGFHTTVFYARTSPSLQRFEGFMILDLRPWSLFQPRMESAYLTESKL